MIVFDIIGDVTIEHDPDMTNFDKVAIRELLNHPLLSHVEEVELFQTIESGRTASTLLQQNPQFPNDEREKYEQAVFAGNQARDLVMKDNYRLAVEFAFKHMNRGVPLMDLIQEGNLGLLKAIEEFDWHKGFRFSTYAYWWVNQRILRAIPSQGKTLELPIRAYSDLTGIHSFMEEFQHEFHHLPDPSQISKALGMTTNKVRGLMKKLPMLSIPASFDKPFADENDGSSLIDLFPAPDSSPEEAVKIALSSENLRTLFGKILNPVEERVMLLRLGIKEGDKDGIPYSQREIGAMLGYTRQRIQQIEKIATEKLRHQLNNRNPGDLT